MPCQPARPAAPTKRHMSMHRNPFTKALQDGFNKTLQVVLKKSGDKVFYIKFTAKKATTGRHLLEALEMPDVVRLPGLASIPLTASLRGGQAHHAHSPVCCKHSNLLTIELDGAVRAQSVVCNCCSHMLPGELVPSCGLDAVHADTVSCLCCDSRRRLDDICWQTKPCKQPTTSTVNRPAAWQTVQRHWPSPY